MNATSPGIAGIAEAHEPKMALLELLAGVAAENKSAFAKLYGLTNRKLFGVALRILGDRSLAEDVLQECYLKVWRNAASYNPAIASPMAWMATIVRHGAIDAVRKRRFEVVGNENEILTLASDDPDPIDELDLARLRPQALAAFARLPENKRRLIMLAYLGDRSRHELSTRFGVPANTVKTHLRRALLELRATMVVRENRTTPGRATEETKYLRQEKRAASRPPFEFTRSQQIESPNLTPQRA